MAWLVRSKKRRLFKVCYRERGTGKHRSFRTRTTDRRLALIHLARVEATLEGRLRANGEVEWDAARLLDAFLAHKGLAKTKDTARSYRTFLAPMVRAWSGTPVERWSVEMAEAYLREKRESRTWVGRTAGIWLSGCREWVKWAKRVEAPLPDFVGDLKAWRHQRRLPRFLDRPHLLALVETARDNKLETYVALTGLAGMRKREAENARPEDVDRARGTITVRGTKGHADRAVALSSRLAEVLARCKPQGGRICPRVKHTPFYEHLQRLCDDAVVPRVSWHALRHSYAMALLDSGASPVEVQAALGHASLATTGWYLTARAGVLADATRRAFDG